MKEVLTIGPVTMQEWNKYAAYFESRDVETGEESETENIWELRRNSLQWDKSKVLLWGRDGWRDGFPHAFVTVQDGEMILERSDERAMAITKALELVRDAMRRA